MVRHSWIAGTVAALALTSVAASPAFAACTRLAFSVNDYGKDGPSKDAQGLLDKYVAKWAGEHGIKKYTTGKKSVSCEMFLNFILFDEHTCKAEASVCWDGPAVTAPPQSAAAEPADGAPVKKAKAAATTTGSIEKPAAEKTDGAPKKDDAGKSEAKDAAAADGAAKPVAKAKPKTVSVAKPAAEPAKPKAPLPEKPESAPVQ